MCDLCGMSSCPPACPSFEGELAGMGHAVGRCALCDGTVHSDERVLVKGGEMLCEACADGSCFASGWTGARAFIKREFYKSD